ncbi:MAG: HAD-IIB family hydrolase [Deltaproteobacteria bacterium]|nr:HAD-IIB family hydrolase [Deltaproteobacteria bacterium]MBW2153212.1 HAD-IIB family hydrolase [Deltaproteobacteria bacterium]
MKHQTYYIQMFSVHGLVRSHNMELGRDADTGGQVKYVIELANSLSQRDDIHRIDLITRLISDKTVSEDYAKPIEQVNEKFRIVRIQCGGRKYVRKELLWPHLDEFIDKTIRYIKREEKIPDVVHAHYADAGYVGMQLASIFGIPFVFTGHSLGRSKKQKLLSDGMKEEDINRKYKINHRIQVEEDILKNADLIIASTHQEVKQQYGMYEGKEYPSYRVIPPGLDIDKFYPFYHDMLPETEKPESARYAQASVLRELNRFFMHPEKPLILALSRPDKRKNISGLVKAFGECRELQTMANLAVFAGIRKDIVSMEENERDVLTRLLLLMDKYDLYGKLAIPKKHDIENEVPELYRIVAEKRGVFVNPALTEPFGITLLEASATGVPIVATNDGGPKDIIKNCQNGILVDSTDPKNIAAAIKEIIADPDKWERFSKNGIMNVRKYYTWKSHSDRYMQEIKSLSEKVQRPELKTAVPTDPIGRRLAKLNFFLITDIDNTLTGKENEHLPKLLKYIEDNYDSMGFGVATGRTIESAIKHLAAFNIPVPDVLITSVGAEIYYGQNLHPGKGWETHISKNWDRRKIKRLLDTFDFLEYQEDTTQRKFKVSYFMKPSKDRLAMIHHLLLKKRCKYNLIYSHQKFLDILPQRASKGKAIRYLSYKWEIPLRNFLVCGDSGNDEEMLRGEPMAAVVGNYSEELENLRGRKKIYFAEKPCSGGILEAIDFYKFPRNPRS